uniref:Direct IAP-binding protein with low pI n=1 Tax=Clastoptera arizonana TaxID=38151 RepID=A0A1B6DVQ4_9HEMI
MFSRKILFNPKELTHENLIHQACSMSVNAASQLLTQTVIAIFEITKNYRSALKKLASVLEEVSTLPSIGFQEDIADTIIECRNIISEEKRQLNELLSLMEYVEKVVIATIETSYIAGAQTACEILSERLHSANTLLENEKREIKELEEEIVRLQKLVILNTKIESDEQEKK